MSTFQSKINTICLFIIAISLAIIAYRLLQPNYVMNEKGQVIDSRSGKSYRTNGSEVVPLETTEEKLKREFPGGEVLNK